MKQLKLGKIFTIAVIAIFCIVGLVIIFFSQTADIIKARMDAFCALVNTMYPYLLPILGGASIGGVIVKVMSKNEKKENI